MLPRDAARADLPKVSTVYPDKSSTAVSPIICVASAIDEYIDDNPEVVLPILVGGGVSTAGVILTISAMAGAVMLPEAVIPVALDFYLGGNNLVTAVASRDILPNEAALADLPTVSTA
jgi:hypothetical protein